MNSTGPRTIGEGLPLAVDVPVAILSGRSGPASSRSTPVAVPTRPLPTAAAAASRAPRGPPGRGPSRYHRQELRRQGPPVGRGDAIGGGTPPGTGSSARRAETSGSAFSRAITGPGRRRTGPGRGSARCARSGRRGGGTAARPARPGPAAARAVATRPWRRASASSNRAGSLELRFQAGDGPACPVGRVPDGEDVMELVRVGLGDQGGQVFGLARVVGLGGELEQQGERPGPAPRAGRAVGVVRAKRFGQRPPRPAGTPRATRRGTSGFSRTSLAASGAAEGRPDRVGRVDHRARAPAARSWRRCRPAASPASARPGVEASGSPHGRAAARQRSADDEHSSGGRLGLEQALGQEVGLRRVVGQQGQSAASTAAGGRRSPRASDRQAVADQVAIGPELLDDAGDGADLGGAPGHRPGRWPAVRRSRGAEPGLVEDVRAGRQADHRGGRRRGDQRAMPGRPSAACTASSSGSRQAETGSSASQRSTSSARARGEA